MNISLFKTFRENAKGGVAVMFSLALVPLMISIGVAVDYSFVIRAKAIAQSQVDASTLAAAQDAVARTAAGNSPNSNTVKARFNQELAARAAVMTPATLATKSVHYSNSAHNVTVTAAVTATVPAYFGGLMGYQHYNLAVGSTVSQGSVTYSNISLVLDVSPSMAIAATPADIASLWALTLAQTGTACAFACHDTDGGALVTNYAIARSGGVNLRFDVVKSAAQTLVNTVSTASVAANQFTMGLYSIGSKLTTIVPPTPSAATITTAIQALDFDRMSVVSPLLPSPAPAYFASGTLPTHYADSDFATTLPALNAALPNVGDGSGPASRVQYAFLVTDGLSDTGALYNSSVSSSYSYPAAPNFSGGNDSGKITGPLDPALCQAMKSRGVQVAVLYVTYVPDPTEPNYNWLVARNAPPDAIVRNLTACATSGLFYQASDSAGISTGLGSLFQTILSRQLRLTN